MLTYHVQGEECIYLDEAVQISKDDGNGDELDIYRVAVEMGNQLDCFGDG